MEVGFAKKIKAIREEHGWSLEEMAKVLGTTKQALSNYERGVRTPKITVASRFAEILHVPMEYLIGEDELDMALRSLSGYQTELMEQEKKKFFDNPDIAALLNGFSRMSPDQIRKAKEVLKAVFTDCFNE